MGLFLISLLGWAGHLTFSYFIIRSIPNVFLRITLSTSFCLILTALSCHELPEFLATSMFIVAICWMISIRLIQLTISSFDSRLTFRSFLTKILWTFLPIVSCSNDLNIRWIVIRDLLFIFVKILVCHWSYRWLLQCEPSDSAERMCLFYLLLMTIYFAADFEGLIIRLVTKNRYTIETFTHHVFLSRSLRIFWGKRYNRVVNQILKESIFFPMKNYSNSSALASMMTFIVSGFLHFHIVIVLFDDISYAISTFFFFFLHGLACCLEKLSQTNPMEHIGWFLTHVFLLLTAPLVLRPFAIEKSFLILNPPPLVDASWLPHLPVPHFCLK